MKIYTLQIDDAERKASYEYWYDRSTRVWYAAEVDAEGNLGETIHEYTKREIIRSIECGFVPRIKQ